MDSRSHVQLFHFPLEWGSVGIWAPHSGPSKSRQGKLRVGNKCSGKGHTLNLTSPDALFMAAVKLSSCVLQDLKIDWLSKIFGYFSSFVVVTCPTRNASYKMPISTIGSVLTKINWHSNIRKLSFKTCSFRSFFFFLILHDSLGSRELAYKVKHPSSIPSSFSRF